MKTVVDFKEYNRREALYNEYLNKELGEIVYKNFHLFEQVCISSSQKGIIIECNGSKMKIMADSSLDFEILTYDRKKFDEGITKDIKMRPIINLPRF